MTKVFINYRREDCQHAAGRLYLALSGHMPDHDIFMDVYNIPGGIDSSKIMKQASRKLMCCWR